MWEDIQKQDMQHIRFAVAKVSEEDAASFSSPITGIPDGPCEINNSVESRNSLNRGTGLDQSRCAFRQHPKETSVLGGMPVNWQVAKILVRNFGILESGQDFSDIENDFQLSEVCCTFIAGKCQDPVGCNRVHVTIQGSDISQASALVQGTASYPMLDKLRTYFGPGASSLNLPDFLYFPKGENTALEARCTGFCFQGRGLQRHRFLVNVRPKGIDCRAVACKQISEETPLSATVIEFSQRGSRCSRQSQEVW